MIGFSASEGLNCTEIAMQVYSLASTIREMPEVKDLGLTVRKNVIRSN
jgi:hypothetical protein